jgi:ADP-ribose pyrophosphatase YjhB (NUDIX family)
LVNSPRYLNTPTVVVVLVPLRGGLLMIRRALAGEGYGKLALPGGFQMLGQTWQEAGAREVLEETGVAIEPASLQVVAVETTPDRRPSIRTRAEQAEARRTGADAVTALIHGGVPAEEQHVRVAGMGQLMSASERIARLRVELDEIEPVIWREFKLPLSTSLKGLHNVIQAVMPWQGCHLYELRVGENQLTAGVE